jgi:hypothetical protein
MAQIDPAVFTAVFAALYVGHQVGDHWVQTSCQAATKGSPGRAGRAACARHVGSLTATKVVFLIPVLLLTGVAVHPAAVLVGLGVDAVSHYWADRRTTLAALASLVGKGGFHRLGAPRPGHDDNPSLGTGAYALDQSWHVAWLLVAALIIGVGATAP